MVQSAPKRNRFHAEWIGSLPCNLYPEKPLLFISDTHLCDGSPADDFAEGDHAEALRWFLATKAPGARLFILGDWLELWQAKLKDITSRWLDLYLLLYDCARIGGNHDAALGSATSLPLRMAGGSIYLEHGHLADPLNSSLGIIGWSVTVLAGWLERLGWRDVDKSAWYWKRIPTPVRRPGRFGKHHYSDYAAKRAKEVNANLVILGHTHKPLLRRHLPNGAVYANCGCWVSKEFAGSWVKVHDGRVSVWQVRAA